MKKIIYLLFFIAFYACENKDIENVESAEPIDLNVSMDNSFFVETRDIPSEHPTLVSPEKRVNGLLTIKWKKTNSSDYANSTKYIYNKTQSKWVLENAARPILLEPYQSYDFDITYTSGKSNDKTDPTIQNTEEKFQAFDDLSCKIDNFDLITDGRILNIELRHSKILLSYIYDTSSLTGDEGYDENFKGNEIAAVNGILPYVTPISDIKKSYQVLLDSEDIINNKIKIIITISKESIFFATGQIEQTHTFDSPLTNGYYYEFELIHSIKITESELTLQTDYENHFTNTINLN